MSIIFDIGSVIFWSVAYILSIVYAVRYKNHIIPYPAILLNLAWETVALLRWMDLIHIPWFAIDIVIALLFLFYEKHSVAFKISYISTYLCVCVFLWFIFKLGWGQLYTSYIADIMMAVLFLIVLLRNKICNGLILAIGLTKLLGDLSAWIFYRYDSFVNIVGFIVLICNIIYVLLCIVLLLRRRYSAKASKIS